MRLHVLLLSTGLAVAGLAATAQAGSCDVAGLRFTGPVCTAKCIVENDLDPTTLCTQ